jgi:hypothetical protein
MFELWSATEEYGFIAGEGIRRCEFDASSTLPRRFTVYGQVIAGGG